MKCRLIDSINVLRAKSTTFLDMFTKFRSIPSLVTQLNPTTSLLRRSLPLSLSLAASNLQIRSHFSSELIPDESRINRSLPVAFEDISRAHYRIQSGIRRTHCDISQFLSEICGCNIYLKKDFTQFTGSFKERGGRNSLMLLSSEQKAKGVITASVITK